MSKDFTIVPQDYIVHHIKTDDMLVHTKDGDYAYHVKTERIPLIRCSECKYASDDGTYGCMCEHFNDTSDAYHRMWSDDFCSRGERNRSEKPNNCEHITEDGVTCAKYPACDDCLDNPLNKVKGSERLVKGLEKPNKSEIPTGSEKPNNCETCKFEIYCPEMCEGCCEWDSHYEPKDEPQTERSRR